MSAAFVLVGVALLIAGRKLFWLLVAALGFLAAYYVAGRFFNVQSSVIMLAAALGCALLGALLAVALQKFAVGVAGFVAGGIISWNLVEQMSWHAPVVIAFIIGGIIGAILAGKLFEWALIALSCMTGSFLIVREMNLSHDASFVVFLLFAGVGFAIQAATRARKRRPEQAPST